MSPSGSSDSVSRSFQSRCRASGHNGHEMSDALMHELASRFLIHVIELAAPRLKERPDKPDAAYRTDSADPWPPFKDREYAHKA